MRLVEAWLFPALSSWLNTKSSVVLSRLPEFRGLGVVPGSTVPPLLVVAAVKSWECSVFVNSPFCLLERIFFPKSLHSAGV